MEWFKLSKSRPAPPPKAPEVVADLEPRNPVADLIADLVAKPPAMTLPKSSATPKPPAMPSPKAVFDTAAEPRPVLRPAPVAKKGFTISSSKDGETGQFELTSPTLTVAKARMLFKSGWRVHITNAAGRQFAPSEFDEILKFD